MIKKYKTFNESNSDTDTDIYSPILRKDVMGQSYRYIGNHLPTSEVVYAIEFPANKTSPNIFRSIGDAELYLRSDYIIGPMEMDSPIGFMSRKEMRNSDYDSIPKWTRMSTENHQLMDGVIIPLPEFREGGVLVLWFKTPKLDTHEYIKQVNED